jgi:FlaA1/EpsC-like NDP-sugar epimerase
MIRALARSVIHYVLRTPGLRVLALAGAYAYVLGLSLFFAYQLRFDFVVPDNFVQNMLSVCAITVAVQLVCLFLFHQFDGLLTYFSTPDLRRLLSACSLATLIIVAERLTIGVIVAPPRGVIVIDFILSIAAIGSLRLSFRALRRFIYHPGLTAGKVRRIGIVGAGDCGAVLVKELLRSPWLKIRPVAFFDDDYRRRCGIHGLPLVGRPERIEELKDKLRLDEVVIAMPSASPRRTQEILQLVNRAGLSCRTVPSLDQLAAGRVTVTNLRPLDIHDLLGRPPVEISHESVRTIIEGRTVIVTGAGGSIGSELCRQILSHMPAALVMLERSEPHLFLIEQELRNHPSLNGTSLVPVIADISRPSRLEQVFHRFRPHVVFHAAAHKHVPLMEIQPEEAIYNNVYATAGLADIAVEYAAERFVFISSDKAVNPTNVMGATKRLGEVYLQAVARRQSGTKFMAVRFGNVLGSSGSVVPTFARQIAAGGPITVTHPEITRYFMTIPEAVSLVLQSSVFGNSGDIFVLDMGTPVRIADLARKMIALAGLTPNDVEIAFTGLRPGEKLYEELSHDVEVVAATPHPKIARLVSPERRVNGADFVDRLTSACEASNADPQGLKLLLTRFLPEYAPAQTQLAPAEMAAAVNSRNTATLL